MIFLKYFEFMFISFIVDDELSLKYFIIISLFSEPNAKFSILISVFLYLFLKNFKFLLSVSKFLLLGSKENIFFISKFFKKSFIDSPL